MKHAELRAERRAALGPDGAPTWPVPARIQGPRRGTFVAQGDRPTYPLDEGLS